MNYDITGTDQLEPATPPTPEEELAEAKAWGYDSAEELYDAMEEAHKPEWAIGRAGGQYLIGAQLPTRDGRRMGNGHIINACEGYGILEGVTVYGALTDAGSVISMTANELDKCFHPPQWVSNVDEVIRKFFREE